jgi:hypothetical protein
MSNLNRREIIRLLNGYYFSNIWNEVKTEFPINIKTHAINKGKGYVGFCFIGNEGLSLPKTNTMYHIYRINKDYIYGIDNIPNGKWIDGVSLCNDYNIVLHTYSHTGRIHHKAGIYLYAIKNSNLMTLAIDRNLLKSFNDYNKDIYASFHIDSTVNDRVTIYSNYYTNDNLDYLVSQNIGKEHQLMCFENGYNIIPGLVSNSHNTNMDIIIDRNIIDDFDVFISDNSHIYYSEKDMLYKEIIHIPKELGFSEEVITHNTCDFFIRNTSTHKGTYIHTTSDKTIGQITHNDFSIPRYIIDAHKDYLVSENTYINVKIRSYEKDNDLVNNGYYLKLLYKTQTDTEIISHLMGEIDNESLSFWKASNLEKTILIKSLLDYNKITDEKLELYIENIGYFNVLSLICNRVISYITNNMIPNTVYYAKPWVWEKDDIIPQVYINGRKVANKNIIYQNYDNWFSVGLKDNVSKSINDKMDLVILPKGNTDCHIFKPNEETDLFYISNNKTFTLYEKINTDTIKTPYESLTVGWKKLDLDASNIIIFNDTDLNQYSIRFGPNNYDKTFLCIYDTYTDYREINLSDYINDNKSFIIPLNKTDRNEIESFPIMNWNNAYVYLNNRYLIKGIDYKIHTVKTDDIILGTYLIVQNLNYFKDVGENNLEVYVSTIKRYNQNIGYVVNDIASRDKDIDLIVDDVSVMHVDGYIESDLNKTDINIKLEENKYPNGASFELVSDIPIEYANIIDNDLYEKDKLIMNNITNYLKNSDEELEQIILSDSHQIMSSYFHYILSGIINDEIVVSYDPINNNMVKQLKEYDYLKDYDLLFDKDNDIDLKFVDIRPTYNEFDLPNINKRNIILKLFKTIFSDDPNQSGVTLNV